MAVEIDWKKHEEHASKRIKEMNDSIGFRPTSPPPDVVEAARRIEKLNYLMAFIPLANAADIETVCDWVLDQNKTIDK